MILFTILSFTFLVGFLVIRVLSNNFLRGKLKFSEFENNHSFLSDFGLIRLDSDKRKFILKRLKGEIDGVDFSNVKGLYYEIDNSGAALLVLSVGSVLDEYEWHVISLVTQDNKRIPIYIIGRYIPKGILMFVINFQKYILDSMGLIKDIQLECHAQLDKIILSFKQAGLDIKLC